MTSRDPLYRPYTVVPDAPIRVVIRGRDGSVLEVQGIVDRVPEHAGNVIQLLEIRDAVARPG